MGVDELSIDNILHGGKFTFHDWALGLMVPRANIYLGAYSG